MADKTQTQTTASKNNTITNSLNSIFSIYQSFQNISSLKDYTNTQIANMASATESLENSTNSLYLNYKQQREQAAYNLEQSTLANMKAKGTAQASAASSGVAGNSINNLFRGYDRAVAVDNYISARNLKYQGIQYSNEIEGLKANALNAINNLQAYKGTSNQFNTNMFDFSYMGGFDWSQVKDVWAKAKKGLRIDTAYNNLA